MSAYPGREMKTISKSHVVMMMLSSFRQGDAINTVFVLTVVIGAKLDIPTDRLVGSKICQDMDCCA